ncbi:bifunctional hydroxymethylpyrimidine kinase/phosphomethylpyrimidine kinase [Bacillus sp. HC-Mk]
MLCDICIIVTAQFTLSYYLLIERTIHIFTTSYIDIFVQLTYPMADLLFLLIGINLLFKPLSLLPKKVGALLGSALILYATTDAIYAYIKYFIPEYSMFTVTPFYQVTLVLVAIACILHTKKPEKQEQVLLTPKIGESIRLSLPYISVVMLIVFILVEYVFAPIIVIGLIITFSFVLIRHSLVRKQNKILLIAQMQFNSELEKQIKLRTEDLVESEKIDTTNTHGAGCTYSAAITAELAKGKPVKEAVKTAKEFITAAIRYSFKINEYVGPTHHGAYRKFVVSKELV